MWLREYAKSPNLCTKVCMIGSANLTWRARAHTLQVEEKTQYAMNVIHKVFGSTPSGLVEM